MCFRATRSSLVGSLGVFFAMGCTSGPAAEAGASKPGECPGAEPHLFAPVDRPGAPISRTPDLPGPELLSKGGGCTGDSECASGFCTDGVCCESRCDGTCETCSAPGSAGTCTPHAAGTDPEIECPTPACYEGMHERFSCDGVSGCMVEVLDCSLYGCDDDSGCYTECRGDEDCVETARCEANRCVAK